MAQKHSARPPLSMEEERERLTRVITRWNEHRLDLFEIALPNENLDFYGVIRFFFQDNQQSVATTKCLRVSSTATSKMVIEALIEKFRPDMRMLGSSYALYEVHQNGEERKLGGDESPLYVQLNWSKGDRDGRFLFKQMPSSALQSSASDDPHATLVSPIPPKGGRKEKKRRRKLSGSGSKASTHADGDSDSDDQQPGALAKAIYKAVPDSRFTRSISNPEAVMRRQRQQKLVKRLHLMRSKDGRPASGGTLRVYAGSLVPEEPYKTLLVSKRATTSHVIRIALEKYGMTGENPDDYCLVQMTVPLSSGENVHLNVVGTCTNQRLLAADEQPLELFNAWLEEGKESVVIFQLLKKNSVEHLLQEGDSMIDSSFMPCLVEVSQDGQELVSGKRIQLTMDRSILGSKEPTFPFEGKFVQINSNEVKPQHCEITNIEGVFTITPIDRGADVKLNGKLIRKPAFLTDQSLIKLSKHVVFRFFDPVVFNRVAALTEASCGHTHPATATAELLNGVLRDTEHRPTSPQPRERAQSHSVLDDAHHQKYSGRSGDNNQLRSAMSANFAELAEKRDQFNTLSSSTSAGMKENGGPRGNNGSLPSFSYQPDSPPSTFKASSEAFLAGHLSEGGEAFLLPAELSFHPTKEGPLLSNMILDLKLSTLQLKLAPAFALYMIVRFHVSPDFQPGANASELRKHLIVMLKNTVSYIKRAVKDARNTTPTLAFWMANTSELLHFLKQDPDVSLLAYEYETHLTNIVQNCFKYLFLCITRDLTSFITGFFEETEDADPEESSFAISDGEDQVMVVPPDVINTTRTSVPGTAPSTISRYNSSTSSMSSRNSRRSRRTKATVGDVMFVLSNSLSTLRKNSVNTSLIIQLFSQLVRFLNAKLVNKLMEEPQYCTRSGGLRLGRRLQLIDVWAKKQGLDLTTERYLAQAMQASILLRCPKYSLEDFKLISSISLLNSRQVTLLLDNYQLEEGEPPLCPNFATRLVTCAKIQCDKVIIRDKGAVQLEEDANFNVSAGFTLPDFGYTGQAMRGVPQGLQDYIRPHENTGLCKLVVNKESSGAWTAQQAPPLTGSSIEDTLPTKDEVASPPTSNLGYQQTGVSSLSSSGGGHQSSPKIVTMVITKQSKSLDISITGGSNAIPHKELGIFVKKLVPGGSAEKDGRLQPGDEILSVDGHELQGLTQNDAAAVLKGSGDSVTLTVAKQAAVFYGLSNLITQSSPSIARRMEALESAHTGSSYAAKQARRREREKKTGYQRTPFRADVLPTPSSSMDNFHSKAAPVQDSVHTSGRGHEWGLGERISGQQAHTGSGYARSNAPAETSEHQKMQKLIQGRDLFMDGEPPISHALVNRDEFSLAAFVTEAPDRRWGSGDRGKSDDRHQPQDVYNFLSHGSQQLSQPQPSFQPHYQPCQPHNASDQFSMDVQHPSLASNSLPHAVTVIQRYSPPKIDSMKEASATEANDPFLNSKRETLESLRYIEKGLTDTLRNLDSSMAEENKLKEQIEREYIGKEMARMDSSSEDSQLRSRHHGLLELEERRKETHKRLKQLEVERHSARTRLQEIQHEIKMCELSLDAEESERMMVKVRECDYSAADKINSRDQGINGTVRDVIGTTGVDSLKRREYITTQRVADGKEGQSLSTQCPPVQPADKTVHSRLIHTHVLGEGQADPAGVKHLSSANPGGHHSEVGHTRQRSGASDSYLSGVRRGSDGSDGYRSLDRQRSLDTRDGLGRNKPEQHQRTGDVSFGFTDDKLGSSRTRQPGVGGWDHSAPPPTLPKPAKVPAPSETTTLSPFTVDGYIEHCSLSPSESDLLEYPRPPPPGANWQSPNQLLTTQLPLHSAKRDQTKDVGGAISNCSHEPAPNAKQWTDREPSERRMRADKAANSSVEGQQSRHEDSYQSLYPAKGQVQYGGTHYSSSNWRRRSIEKDPSHNHHRQPIKLQKQPQPQGLLQFQNPPLGSEETTTSSQVTGYSEDIASFGSFLYSPVTSHGNEPIMGSQRSEGGVQNEGAGLFPSAYNSSLDVVGPGRGKEGMTSPRVVPVTTRVPDSYYSRPHPPQSPHKSSATPSATSHRSATGKRPNVNFGVKTDLLLKYPQGVTTVSRTDL